MKEAQYLSYPVLSVFNSAISGSTPTPEPFKSGHVASSAHHAALPAASCPLSGFDSHVANFHCRPSSFSYCHSCTHD